MYCLLRFSHQKSEHGITNNELSRTYLYKNTSFFGKFVAAVNVLINKIHDNKPNIAFVSNIAMFFPQKKKKKKN